MLTISAASSPSRSPIRKLANMRLALSMTKASLNPAGLRAQNAAEEFVVRTGSARLPGPPG